MVGVLPVLRLLAPLAFNPFEVMLAVGQEVHCHIQERL